MKIDYLIIGQGLSGSIITWLLLNKNKKVFVIDEDINITSSKIAAGIMSPLPGGRFNLTDEVSQNLLFANSFYKDIEKKINKKIFNEKNIIHLFSGEKEKRNLENKLLKKKFIIEPFVDKFLDPNDIDFYKHFIADNGGFIIKKGGWLDLKEFIQSTKNKLIKINSYCKKNINSKEIKILNNSIQWENITAKKVIFCQGWKNINNHFFKPIKMNPLLGDIFKVKIPEFKYPINSIVKKSIWIRHIKDKTFLIGSTHKNINDIPGAKESNYKNLELFSKDTKNDLISRIKKLIPFDFSIESHKSAIRPVIEKSKPFYGRHKEFPQVVFFNGLGSKGCINGPLNASKLVDNLLYEKEIPEGHDISKNDFIIKNEL